MIMKAVFSFLLFSMFSLVTHAEEKLPLFTEYWKSAAFLKEFNGSYRINASIEPVLTGEQRAELVSIQSLMASGARASALSKLQASKSAKTSPAILFNIANIQSEEGELDKAIENYLAAIKILPSFRRAHQNLAYAYARKNTLEKAYDHLLEVVRLGGNDGSVLGLLGNCYQQKERYQAALLCFQKAQLTQPDTVEWKLGTAFCLQKLDKTKEALVQYEELEKLMPDSADVKLQLVSLFVSLERKEDALVKLELLRRLGELDAQNELWLGTLYLAEGNVFLGGETLKRVMEREEVKEVRIFLNAISYCADLGLDELARELLVLVGEKELKSEVKVKLTRLEAQLDILQADTESKGLAALEELIKTDPTDAHSHYLLGRHLLAKGKALEAVPILENALLIEGDFQLKLYVELAKAQVELENFKDALVSLKEYLSIDEDENIRAYYDALQELVKAKHR